MENMQYAEELVKEFLVFRGFANTLQAFESELSTDIGKGFQLDKILDLIFTVYIPKFQAEKLVGLLNFFKQCLSSSYERVFFDTLCKLEVSILRYYVVRAVLLGRKDKVVEFYGINGNNMLQRNQDWAPWFGEVLSSCFFSFLIPRFFFCFIYGIEHLCSNSILKES